MRYRNNKTRPAPIFRAWEDSPTIRIIPAQRQKLVLGLTLVEMVIAMAIMAIIFAAVLPQFRAIQNSWDSKQAAAETLQNGRVLIDHLNRNLSKAVRITAVSGSSVTNGYIEFEDNDANDFRYDVNSTTNYVQFGLIGDLFDLAGPVSQLKFTCYDANDLDTPITDVNAIRCVKVETKIANTGPGHDQTFTTWAYLRTNALPSPLEISKPYEPWLEFAMTGVYPALCQIDATHYLCAYAGGGDDGFAQVLTVDTGTWEVSNGTEFEYDEDQGLTPALAKIDGTHYLSAYAGDGDDGWATVLTVNTGTWTITNETPFEFDASNGETPALSKIDDTNYLCAYAGDGDDGWATVLTVDTGTWEITQGEPFEFDSSNGETPALSKIDNTHYLCAYAGGGSDGWAVVLTVIGGGLRGWWKLNETSGLNAADSSGYGNHGTLTDMAGDEWTTGQVGGALAFDGTEDYIDCGSDSSLNIRDAITLGAWINMEQRPAKDAWYGILGKISMTEGTYQMYVWGPSATETILGGLFTINGHDTDAWEGTIDIPPNGWAHVVVTFDGTKIKTYVNGQPDNTKNKSGTIDDTSVVNLTIGEDLGANFFDGKIDDVRVYNRALGLEEITALAGGYNEWQITNETPFEFDDKKGLNPALSQMSSTNYLCTYQAFQDLGWAVILKVDTGSWTISTEDTYEFEENYATISALAQIDQTHYLCAHTGPWSDGWAILLASTPSLDTISKQGAGLEFDPDTGLAPTLVEIDDSHYLCAYEGQGNKGCSGVLTVEPSIRP